MIGKFKCVLVLTILFWNCIDVDGYQNDYQLLLKDNGPVTTGSNITLNATIVDSKGICVKGSLTFRYEDDAFPRHILSTTIKNCVAIFYIPFGTTIGASSYRYLVEVSLELIPFIKRPIASGRGELTVTENLNGQLLLFQNNTNIIKHSPQTTYVSSSIETLQKVKLNDADFEYLNKSNSFITVYWFIDCIYQGNTTNFTFSTNYTKSDIQHEVLSIVVADIDKNKTSTALVPPVVTATVSPNMSTITSTISDTTVVSNISASTMDVTATTSTVVTTTTTTTTSPSKMYAKFPLSVIDSTYTSECQQKKHIDLLLSVVQLENQQKYGYFSQTIFVKDPIKNVKIQGNVWIQEGEMLNLQVSCNGSGPFRYCAHYVQGPYNVTGNEVCPSEKNLILCQMQFFHYLREPTNYTLVVITANDVSKIVTPIGINIYKVKKQPQISVIVVPVTFSSIAVIIIVFGIAYYFQNRSRYMVEVADFDFANNSDMECKTFRERLRDAISQAINRTQDYSEYDGSEEQIGSLAAPQNQKYGSMQ
ncbi:uncharacterized protein LOC112693034 [Sipha flava]|uniref:Uncharacterized protein LOC112693034 n=1 Tax=Sipha flava TaxID=143950 RepID=A0A8B8GKE1_9HEMI|nr:uncharacterized protein LOC112693034 [Sipha flava]